MLDDCPTLVCPRRRHSCSTPDCGTRLLAHARAHAHGHATRTLSVLKHTVRSWHGTCCCTCTCVPPDGPRRRVRTRGRDTHMGAHGRLAHSVKHCHLSIACACKPLRDAHRRFSGQEDDCLSAHAVPSVRLSQTFLRATVAYRWLHGRCGSAVRHGGARTGCAVTYIAGRYVALEALPCATVLLDKDLILTGAVLDGDA
jgi:hypothetical protein